MGGGFSCAHKLADTVVFDRSNLETRRSYSLPNQRNGHPETSQCFQACPEQLSPPLLAQDAAVVAQLP